MRFLGLLLAGIGLIWLVLHFTVSIRFDGLPLLIIFAGFIVLMVRRIRLER